MADALTDTPPAPMAPLAPKRHPLSDDKRSQAAAEYYKQGSDKLNASRDEEKAASAAARAEATATSTAQQAEAAKPIAAPEYKPTNPVKEWGSIAVLFAGLASLRTRTPMNNALNAAAGAIEAYRQNDTEKYQREYQKWQMEMTNATRMANYEQKQYEHVLAEVDKREGLSEKEYNDKMRDLANEAKFIAVGLHDDVAIKTLEQRGVIGFQNLQIKRASLVERQQRDAGKIDEQHEIISIRHKIEATPEYKKAGVKNDIHTQVRLLREADPRISAQFDSKYMSIIERERARLPSTPAGKQFYAVQQADSAAAAAEQELKRYGHLSAATTTRLMDGYQKVLTGQALRAFMMKMYENHIPYNDRAQQALSLFDPHGGGLSANQAHIVLGQLKDLKSSVSNEYAKEVENSARGVDAMGGRGDIIRTTFTGADPSLGPPRDGVRKTQPTTAPHAFAEQSRAQQVLSAGFGAPVTITSGHRSAGHNTKIKGSPSSEHVSGTAYDFKVQGVSPEAAGMKLAAQLIKRGVPFDQILMQPGDTHVGWGSKVRNQLAYEDVRGKVTRALTADQVRHAYQRGEITAAEGETLLSHYFGMK